MITDFLDSIPSEILSRSKSIDLKIRSVNAHNAIDEVLSQTVLSGGKRLRPLLTYLMANLFKVNLDQITPFARASELVHAASLSHDDVIDNATVRRGSASINILASNKKAVLAGDYLLSSVIVDLCQAGRLSLVNEMSLVIKDLSEGEWLQLDLIESRKYTRDLIKEIALKKTSSVMSFCSVAPAIYSNQSKDIQELARQFGLNLGLAFQLIDDTLDFSGDSLKDQALDLRNGIVNSVLFELLSDRDDLMKRFQTGEDLSELILNEDMSKYIEIIALTAQGYLEKSSECLVRIGRELTKTIYADQDNQLKNAIYGLEMVIAFLSVRKN